MAGAGHGGDPADGAVAAERALAVVFREETARLTAALVRVVGDFAVAEEVVQDALLLAWEHWRADGIPSNPGGWLWTVARRRAVRAQRRPTTTMLRERDWHLLGEKLRGLLSGHDSGR